MRLAAQDTIGKKWIEQVRKTWKGWVKRAPSVGAYEVEPYLLEAKKWVEALSRDLAYAKGFFIFLRTENLTEVYKLRVKALEHLKSLLILLDSGVQAAQFWDRVVTPGTDEYRMGGQQRLSLLQTQAKKMGLDEPAKIAEADALAAANSALVEKALAQQFRAIRDEVVTRADEKLARQFLALLTRIVTQRGDVEFGAFDREFSVGRVKVVMTDLQHMFPQERGELRHPVSAEDYAKRLGEAETLLRRKGLGFLWYGTMFVECKDCGGENPNGAHYGMGAVYHALKDTVTIYQGPSSGLPRLIAHELGHRYYFKFMGPAERARFDSYFKEVSAVSDYGGESSAEDFAEVFAHYIDGQDLTRDQLERFKSFLKRGSTTMLQRIIAEARELKSWSPGL